jgi:hypothetical protein
VFIALPVDVSAGRAMIAQALAGSNQGQRRIGWRGSVPETGADGDALAADGATAAEDGSAALGLHAGAETMGFHALAAIGLKCALGHNNALLSSSGNLRLNGKIQVYRRRGQESSVNCLQGGAAPNLPRFERFPEAGQSAPGRHETGVPKV